MDTRVSAQAWRDLASSLDIDEAALRAVCEIESSGSGFLPPPSKRPKVLFEGHAFHRLTGGRFDAEHPTISYAKWDRGKYSRSPSGEWKRLEAACRLDRPAALQAASWGLFQIMGFNYPYCGCDDVEAFVSMQHAGADQQFECFARFIARPPFLAALRNRQWERFAAAYNGPGHAKTGYARKLAEAYARHSPAAHAAAGKRRRKAAGYGRLPPGRKEFAPVTAVRRRKQRRRNVRPDPVDLRDWEYRPNIAIAPRETLLPNDPRPIKQQGETSACTGFALATVIEYLLERAERPAEAISGFMLYNMARRYDEWADDDGEDSGSSLRGALKGWSRHGASCDRSWPSLEMPAAGDRADADWWLDAVKRPMGAYYRVSPENIRDIHIALAEVGAVYASALTHEGWDALSGRRRTPAPTAAGAVPVIGEGRGDADQGHAFAIVGYRSEGFIVQNSWGPAWGAGGFAVLPYSDWLKNAMDCWVVQLGILTAEHEAVANASSLRVERKSGRVILSSNETLADHEISPFVVNMANEGRLSTRGRFRTRDEDLRALLETHLRAACEEWGLARGDAVDVAIYAHGGLTDENAAAASARAWISHLYSRRIFPVFLMWETGALQTICNLFEDVVKGEAELAAAGGPWSRFRERFSDWKDERLEGLARFPGSKLWNEMKQNAAALSGHAQAGVAKLFKLLEEKSVLEPLPRMRLHLIGHSAGAIVHSHLGARALSRGLDVASVALLAPAVRVDVFEKLLGETAAARKIPLLVASLTDAAERSDGSCKPYGQSLLYLVSRSFEEQEETPILGMEKHLVPALATTLAGTGVRRLRCPGGRWDETAAATRATTHGGLDDDAAVREAVAAFIHES